MSRTIERKLVEQYPATHQIDLPLREVKSVPQPIPPFQGIGFTLLHPFSVRAAAGYRFERVGRYFNYHFTLERHSWPIPSVSRFVRLDGFSPNLNKFLHVGHLRNLVLASCLTNIAGEGKGVAMLGASLGILDGAEKELDKWLRLARYNPTRYLDCELPTAFVVGEPGSGSQQGCVVWNGPKGPVIIQKSDGKTTYALHDLIFAKLIGPTHYITGSEQKDHFAELGLESKHLSMGLVLGMDGKKIKSRDGTALSAKDAFDAICNSLSPTPNPSELTWNILAFNFAAVGREQNLKFNPEAWSKPDHPGLYITYTYARVMKSIKMAGSTDGKPEEQDVPLLGFAAYREFYLERSRELMDTAPLANYTYELAKRLTAAYHSERIIDGRTGFRHTIAKVAAVLRNCMELLSMYPLVDV